MYSHAWLVIATLIITLRCATAICQDPAIAHSLAGQEDSGSGLDDDLRAAEEAHPEGPNPRIPDEAIAVDDLLDGADTSFWRTSQRCGANSVYAYLQLLGHQVDYDTLVERIPITKQGSAISDLRDACSRVGHEAVIVKATPTSLSQLVPAIVHCEEEVQTTGHYNTVIAFDGSDVTYIDGTLGMVKHLAAVEFFRSWSGYALTSSDNVWARSRNPFSLRAASLLIFGAALGSLFLWCQYRCSKTRSKIDSKKESPFRHATTT